MEIQKMSFSIALVDLFKINKLKFSYKIVGRMVPPEETLAN